MTPFRSNGTRIGYEAKENKMAPTAHDIIGVAARAAIGRLEGEVESAKNLTFRTMSAARFWMNDSTRWKEMALKLLHGDATDEEVAAWQKAYPKQDYNG